jgi:hypothetical protein
MEHIRIRNSDTFLKALWEVGYWNIPTQPLDDNFQGEEEINQMATFTYF